MSIGIWGSKMWKENFNKRGQLEKRSVFHQTPGAVWLMLLKNSICNSLRSVENIRWFGPCFYPSTVWTPHYTSNSHFRTLSLHINLNSEPALFPLITCLYMFLLFITFRFFELSESNGVRVQCLIPTEYQFSIHLVSTQVPTHWVVLSTNSVPSQYQVGITNSEPIARAQSASSLRHIAFN